MRTTLICTGFLLALVFATRSDAADRPWEKFPAPSKEWLTATAKDKGCAPLKTVQMFYAVFGEGDPVLLIHGGLGSADVWQAQVEALAANHKVIVADSRGHGRSTRVVGQFLHYRDMTDDYVALLDHLGLAKVAVVGWSDGGIIGLDMAMRYPDRVSRLFANAANSDPGGTLRPSGPAWGAYDRWARENFNQVGKERCGSGSTARSDYAGLRGALAPMWRSEPRWTRADLSKIAVPTAIVLGERDEAIQCGHTRYLAAAIPGVKLIILPSVGHFALRQDPTTYNRAIISFLDGGPAPPQGNCR